MAQHWGFEGSARPSSTLSALRHSAVPLSGRAGDYTQLLDMIGVRRFTLLGEASHGTHEFYAERAAITKQLIQEKGYTAIAVEGDWPDAYRVNRYVRGLSGDRDANEALSGFRRFPAWLWRNRVVFEFVEWLREYNGAQPSGSKVGFYGIDLYSLFTSMEAVLDYLDKTDPPAAQRARFRYGCFDHFGENTQAYGYAATFGMGKSCEQEVLEQLVEMTRQAGASAALNADTDADERFFAEQNARLVKNAEQYYRTMFQGRVSSWNLRDGHMSETLQALDRHLSTPGHPARIGVWAHNSHLGDASATEMGDQGEWNVGQLMREHYGEQVTLVGFTTHSGSVTVASDWGAEAERKRVQPGLPGSYEALFHELGEKRFMLLMRGNPTLGRALEAARLERAIGVIYLPQTERMSHYFHARLAQQFDAIIHIDRSRALEPLERSTGWLAEAPETYPTGV